MIFLAVSSHFTQLIVMIVMMTMMNLPILACTGKLETDKHSKNGKSNCLKNEPWVRKLS